LENLITAHRVRWPTTRLYLVFQPLREPWKRCDFLERKSELQTSFTVRVVAVSGSGNVHFVIACLGFERWQAGRGTEHSSSICLVIILHDRIDRSFFFTKNVPNLEQCIAFSLRDLRARRVCSSAMDKSRVATINLAYSISHGAVSKQIYLTQYGLMAERHWREFRPKMVRELEAKGTLIDALFEAQERTIGEMEALTRKLETEHKLTPQQAHDRAWEMIREKYILLPPEENL